MSARKSQNFEVRRFIFESPIPAYPLWRRWGNVGNTLTRTVALPWGVVPHDYHLELKIITIVLHNTVSTRLGGGPPAIPQPRSVVDFHTTCNNNVLRPSQFQKGFVMPLLSS